MHNLLFESKGISMTSRFGAALDKHFMEVALAQARKAFEQGEVPIGAVVVNDQGEIVSRGYNMVEKFHTQLFHAEAMAISKGGAKLGDWRLQGCWLYVTLEPCLMCMGLVRLSRMDGIVFAASSPLFGYRLDKNLTYQVYKDDTIKIIEGVCLEEAVDMLKKFFKKRRNIE